MAYRRPPAFVRRVFNPIAIRLGLSGTEALEVRGHRSGAIRRTAVIPLEHEGALYLVSPRGGTEWVRNLRAAGGECRVGRHGRPREMSVEEVPVGERRGILSAYQAMAGWMVHSHFAALPDAADHPVFRLTSPERARPM